LQGSEVSDGLRNGFYMIIIRVAEGMEMEGC
jgi:hypothetical protein